MGKTRTKIMDDSQPSAEVKSEEKKTPRKKEEDSLVAKLKEELGIEEKPQPEDTSEVKPEVKVEASTSEVSKEMPKPFDKTQGKQVLHDNRKIKHPTSKKIRSKKYIEASKDLDRNKFYPLTEALDMVKKVSYAKFNDETGTLEVHINTYATGLHGFISLPFASGKKIRILAFGKGAEISGADLVGDDSAVETILNEKVDFDILITTPEWMPKLAKTAKVLGPKGLMPNPKNGTITDDLKKAVESFQSGKSEYKTEAKGKVIHLGLGSLSQPNEELEANIKTLLQTLGKTKVSKVTLSPTMGAGVKLDLASI